jgi:hypothetical protein
MKYGVSKKPFWLRGVLLFALSLLMAGCADIIKSPPDSPETGWVSITIANPARTVFPLLDQFSKIEITFQRQDAPGILPPVDASGGTALVYLAPGTWELTASAYNSGDPPEVAARAVNTLTRTGSVIAGETNFVLGPTGTGSGTLEYAVALPADPAIKPGTARIRIEQNGVEIEERSLDEEGSGVFALDGGRYIADIVMEAQDGTSAVYREAVVILPGLLTTLEFAPTAADFMDQEARAALTRALAFDYTAKNSSRTRLEEAGGDGISRTQRLSAPVGTALVYFALKKIETQTVTIDGADAAKVSRGPADGSSPSPNLEVFTVDPVGMAAGDLVFTLTLAEPYKENVAVTVTVSLGYLLTLNIASLPDKHIYTQGDNFDPTGMVLEGTYSDGSALVAQDRYTVAGFDTASLGEKTVHISVREKPAGSFAITVQDDSIRDLYFDYGHRRSAVDVQPDRYTVPLGRTLVLAPVKWHIPSDAVYEWKVDSVIQASTTEYLSITPTTQKDYAVTVTAKKGGAAIRTASTTVECVAPAGTYKRSAGGNNIAKKIYHMAALGHIAGSDGELYPPYNGCGSWGGYIIYEFDHSVERGSGKELGIWGNAFGGWSEPGVVWVMQDENGDGLPNDSWYELAGSHTLLPQTKRRYALTYTQGAGWVDNLGGVGIKYPSNYPVGAPSPMTFVGTGLPGRYADAFTGYVDANCEQRYNIRDAIQVDGSPIYLAYIDFVKVQTGLNQYSDTFLEISTEIYSPPQDMSVPDPNLLLVGTSLGGGQYSYQFINNSGYDLNITLGTDPEFILNAGDSITKTIALSQAYYDYYGGNVTATKTTGRVTFADRPE